MGYKVFNSGVLIMQENDFNKYFLVLDTLPKLLN